MAGRYALVVASDRYDDERLRALVAPRNDADALREVLGDPYVGAFDVVALVDEASGVVAEAVEAFFADRARDDLLLLYFSGHGLKDDQGRLFLAMRNTRPDRLASTGLGAAFVREAMERTRARQTVLLLDCCYSGAFAGAAKADPQVHTRDAFAASGCVVLTASDAIQYSFEDDGVRGEPTRSVFTRVLVDGITSGAADRDRDGDISLDELYDYVHDRIVAERPQQRPGKWAWDLHGRLVIARNPCWSVPEHVVQAIESPYPAMRLGAVDELTHLLRTGNDLVRATAHSLLESMTDDDSRSVAAAARAAAGEEAEPSGPDDVHAEVHAEVHVLHPEPVVTPRVVAPPRPERHLRLVRPAGHRTHRAGIPWLDTVGLLVVAGALSAIAVVLGLRSGKPVPPQPIATVSVTTTTTPSTSSASGSATPSSRPDESGTTSSEPDPTTSTPTDNLRVVALYRASTAAGTKTPWTGALSNTVEAKAGQVESAVLDGATGRLTILLDSGIVHCESTQSDQDARRFTFHGCSIPDGPLEVSVFAKSVIATFSVVSSRPPTTIPDEGWEPVRILITVRGRAS